MRTEINQGGLIRCCIQTIREDTGAVAHEGERLSCKQCGNRMVVKKGLWYWDAEWYKEREVI